MQEGDMETVKELYRQALKEHGDVPSAVFLPKGRQDIRWEALTGQIPLYSTGTLLDYGCGLAHMQPWLKDHHPGLTYCGADMVPDFIAHCRAKYPHNTFYEVSEPSQIPGTFKYTVAAGTFNIRYVDDDERHWDQMKEIVRQLWQKTTSTMSLDFMHTMVDYRQEAAYHQDPAALLNFLRAELSPLVRFDFSYLPYEFAAIVLRPH
jgi:hypothetical protein